MHNESRFKTFSIGLAFVWLLIFVFIPNGMVLLASFLTKNTENLVQTPFTLSNYLTLFDSRYGTILSNSVCLAGLSSLICLFIGYPTAWMMTRLSKRHQVLFLFLLILPFWTNSLIRTYALKILLGNHGVLNDAWLAMGLIDKPLRLLYTQTAVVFGFVSILLPFMVLPIYNAIDKLPPTFLEAARDLGANRWQTFYKIVLPLTTSGIIAGFLMVFLPAMGMFYLSDLLGGSKNMLIGNVIKDQVLITRDWPLAAAASISLIAIMALFILGYYQSSKTLKEPGS
jgi:spermidine/putrescine transport system permease protein